MKYLFLILTCVSFFSCSSLPGESQMTEQELNFQAGKAYSEVKTKSQISSNKEWTEMVHRVSKRIAAASGEKFQWEDVLIESPEVNAWCMPGGKMAVYTGIMKILKTEAALAAVMGHEVAHATLRHGLERYSRAAKGNLAGMIIGGAMVAGGQLLCKTNTCRALTGLGGAAAGFAVTFFDRKFSRDDETAADKMGQIYMARAGYDPAEAPRLWERMAQASGGKAGPEFMSTHPSDERRKSNLNEWMPEAISEYRKAQHKYGLGENIP